MRVHLYGTQGSGSVFPRRSERAASREVADHRLLERVFEDLGRHLDDDGKLDCTIGEILGAEPGREALIAYRNSLQPELQPVYGGWTTCVHVEADDGTDIVFDCGSGFRNCAKDVQEKWGECDERTLFVFGSHSHRDHTEGFDQASVCFDPRNTIRVFGNSQFLRSLNDYLGVFSRHVREDMLGVQTPLYYDLMPANFESARIVRPGESGRSSGTDSPGLWDETHPVEEAIVIGDVSITPFEVYHPAPCFGYRVESGGKVFVFCTDHELRHCGEDEDDGRQAKSLAAEARVRRYSQGADLLYRDGQFLQLEYDGEKGIGSSRAIPRLDWGHSCIEDVAAMATECDVKHTLIGHHDPNRDWSELDRINESLLLNSAAQGRRIELAQAEMVIEL
jgi:ribonuclease BN (tRNA processing enzyme)